MCENVPRWASKSCRASVRVAYGVCSSVEVKHLFHWCPPVLVWRRPHGPLQRHHYVPPLPGCRVVRNGRHVADKVRTPVLHVAKQQTVASEDRVICYVRPTERLEYIRPYGGVQSNVFLGTLLCESDYRTYALDRGHRLRLQAHLQTSRALAGSFHPGGKACRRTHGIDIPDCLPLSDFRVTGARSRISRWTASAPSAPGFAELARGTCPRVASALHVLQARIHSIFVPPIQGVQCSSCIPRSKKEPRENYEDRIRRLVHEHIGGYSDFMTALHGANSRLLGVPTRIRSDNHAAAELPSRPDTLIRVAR